jgi:predicted nucleotidyltransferase
MDPATYEKLLAGFNALLDLVAERMAHDAAYLRSRGIAPPQHDLAVHEFRQRLAALRIDLTQTEAT